MEYELINPSDCIHFDAPDLEFAAVVVCLLGRGAFLADPVGPAESKKGPGVPCFLFGGHDEWFTENFGGDLATSLDRCAKPDRLDDLLATLRSVRMHPPGAIATSLNDICGTAAWLADRIEQIYRPAVSA